MSYSLTSISPFIGYALSFLSSRETIPFACASRQYRRLATSDATWRLQLQRDFPSLPMSISAIRQTYIDHVHRLRLHLLCNRYPPHRISSALLITNPSLSSDQNKVAINHVNRSMRYHTGIILHDERLLFPKFTSYIIACMWNRHQNCTVVNYGDGSHNINRIMKIVTTVDQLCQFDNDAIVSSTTNPESDLLLHKAHRSYQSFALCNIDGQQMWDLWYNSEEVRYREFPEPGGLRRALVSALIAPSVTIRYWILFARLHRYDHQLRRRYERQITFVDIGGHSTADKRFPQVQLALSNELRHLDRNSVIITHNHHSPEFYSCLKSNTVDGLSEHIGPIMHCLAFGDFDCRSPRLYYHANTVCHFHFT